MSGTSSYSITHAINYSKVIGKCPEIDITLGGIPVRCLYDSGSQVTTITNTYYEQHFKDQTLVDCRSLIRLTAPNGLEIPLVGLMICDVVMNSQTFKNAHILVVKDPRETDKGKLQAVMKFEKPDTEKKVRQFLGLTRYFRRFIRGFAQIAAPLYTLLSGGKKRTKTKKQLQKWKELWDDACDAAFETLKYKLTNAPILGFPDFTLPFCVETYASLLGFGAILFQIQDGKISGDRLCEQKI